MKKLMAVLAHPDDEGAIAGTLIHYARQGMEVSLVCATRGEEGEISDPALATPATLAEVRTAELESAAAIIGINPLYFLEYRDSGMAGTPANEDPRSFVQAPAAEATGRIVQLIRETKPDVVITFEPFGWYGHPDHRMAQRRTAAAVAAANDPGAYPQAGPPYQPPFFYYAVIPVSRFEKILSIARERGIEFDAFTELPLAELAKTEAQITHQLDVENYLATKQAARDQHRTQFGEDNLFNQLPPELSKQLFSFEHYIQVIPEPGKRPNEIKETDLFTAVA